MAGEHNWKICDWFIYIFPSTAVFWSTEAVFCIASGINQSFKNLLRVNSLNNLHRVARLTLVRRLQCFGLWRGTFLSVGVDSCRVLASNEKLLALVHATRQGASEAEREKRNYLFKQTWKCLNWRAIKANFTGNLVGWIKAIRFGGGGGEAVVWWHSDRAFSKLKGIV